MDVPQRKTLPHAVPLWVNPHAEVYFISINCRERFTNQLALPDVSMLLFETVQHRQEKFLWWPHIFLLMPDHLHALISFPPSGQPLQSVVSQWKEWSAKQTGIGCNATSLNIACVTMKAGGRRQITSWKILCGKNSWRGRRTGRLFISPLVNARSLKGDLVGTDRRAVRALKGRKEA